MVIPSPFVYWAQTEDAVSLKIDLKNVNQPDVKVLENKVKFSAQGIGARGQSQYEFSLDLYSSVKPNDGDNLPAVMRVFDNRVELSLQKSSVSWWPRLTAQPQKPAWLKINFDLWKSEDLQDSDEEKRDIMKDYPGMYDKLHKEELGYRKEDFKKVYLIFYNLFQAIGFTYALAVMAVRYYKLGYDSVKDTFEHVGPAMKFLHLMQILEILHPIFGYTKGGPFAPFAQLVGRIFVTFVMLGCEPRMQTKPVVCYLFVVWSIIEIVRHAFYFTQLRNKEYPILTWLRYTAWIPLYPMGISGEAFVMISNIQNFQETQLFNVSMPNDWNFSYNMPTHLRIHSSILCGPGVIFLMGHMFKMMMRRRQQQADKIKMS
ncbi:very-long-chain (3R)-3-hydroxyacyl-CoA dehydratase isoform X2 [Plodia interpunctella]|uniref:very-long-chain (3R)-3-hydroxyacyl-CoA dehydratase isoform X2 n=1 Tax=Plodia interpunctella TaxID=58824 RepID=UPI00236864DC|nr:very-long-chain (3R)-3-hydroxyacyl-CoA dehydratase isoform X2 [Plodia interpunctella]